MWIPSFSVVYELTNSDASLSLMETTVKQQSVWNMNVDLTPKYFWLWIWISYYTPRKWWSWDLNTMLLTKESLFYEYLVNMLHFFHGSLPIVHVWIFMRLFPSRFWRSHSLEDARRWEEGSSCQVQDMVLAYLEHFPAINLALISGEGLCQGRTVE